MTCSNSADIVILGGGSGGYSCALRAAELGLSVVVIKGTRLAVLAFTAAASRRKHCFMSARSLAQSGSPRRSAFERALTASTWWRLAIIGIRWSNGSIEDCPDC